MATVTLARPPRENQPMTMRFCGRDLTRAIDEVCVAIKRPAFIDPLALNQSSLADEPGLLFLLYRFSPEAKNRNRVLISLLQSTTSWKSGRNWTTRKAIHFYVSVAWLAARRTTWLLSARSTGIKCKFLVFRNGCKWFLYGGFISKFLNRIGAVMHLRSQDWDMDWLYEFVPRHGEVL